MEYKNKNHKESTESELEDYEQDTGYIIPKQVIPVNLNIINIKRHESVIDIEND